MIRKSFAGSYYLDTMLLEDLKNKKILILGYGTEGKATEQYLKRNIPNTIVDIADQNIDENYLLKQKNYDLVIKTPGIQKSLVTIPYTTATNIFFANAVVQTVAVTGSKGKSTTASLIHHILKSSGKKSHLAGNIGNPLLSELLDSNNPDDIFVCELSSYQTEDLHYSPHISVITSLFPEHMDYHGGVIEYYKAKRRLIEHAGADDYFIYNPKYELLRTWAANAKCHTATMRAGLVLKSINLLGAHNRDNALLAASVCSIIGIADEDIINSIASFNSLPHRLEHVGTFHTIQFYDDAISTAPESTIEAIKALSPIGTLFLGGEDRGYDFTALVKIIIEYKIPNLVLFPESGEKIERLLKENTPSLPNMYKTASMRDAVEFAYKNSPQGSICLLSNASPSYSLWKNFEVKGAEFQKYIKELN